MKKSEIYSYVYDFVSHLMERVDILSVKSIILFGSVSRGDFDMESDVDLFIDTKKEVHIENEVKSVLNEFYAHSRKTWVLRGVENQIKPIVGDLDSSKWANLRREMASNGFVIYGNYAPTLEYKTHYILITYYIHMLKPREKASFIRSLFGYSLKSGKKKYVQEGLLKQVSGIKLAKSVFMVPAEQWDKVYNIFSKYGDRILFEKREVWTKQKQAI